MDERWQQIENLYHGALALPPDQIEAYLLQHSDDPSLRQEVRELLASDARAAGFLEQPAVTALAALRESDLTQTIARPA